MLTHKPTTADDKYECTDWFDESTKPDRLVFTLINQLPRMTSMNALTGLMNQPNRTGWFEKISECMNLLNQIDCFDKGIKTGLTGLRSL